MKVLLLSTYMGGGAANCAIRLGEALQSSSLGLSVKMMVRKGTKNNWVFPLEGLDKLKGDFSFVAERAYFLPFEKNKKIRWAFSPNNVGVDITHHPLVKEADVIHLHWVNHGFITVDTIKKLAALGKPIIWSMHDMWIFTGGCHYSGSCRNFEQACGNCQFLKIPSENDITKGILAEKLSKLKNKNIRFVGSSKWLASEARKSKLLKNEHVTDMVTPVNTSFFRPIEGPTLRSELGISSSKKVILFLAMSAEDERKGFQYLLQALILLGQQSTKPDFEIIIVGKNNSKHFTEVPFPIHLLGLVSDKSRIVEAYNAANVFVIPSLEDNLPNTIMESLACGTPVVGFNTGGIPEMIDHKKTGYVAEFKNAQDLARGIQWVLDEEGVTSAELKSNSRIKAESHYSYPVVAKKYFDLYNEVLKS